MAKKNNMSMWIIGLLLIGGAVVLYFVLGVNSDQLQGRINLHESPVELEMAVNQEAKFSPEMLAFIREILETEVESTTVQSQETGGNRPMTPSAVTLMKGQLREIFDKFKANPTDENKTNLAVQVTFVQTQCESVYSDGDCGDVMAGGDPTQGDDDDDDDDDDTGGDTGTNGGGNTPAN